MDRLGPAADRVAARHSFGRVPANETNVLRRTAAADELIRSKMPHVSIVYVSMKPSPSRKKFFPEMQKANALIRKYLQGKTEAVFVDVYNPMLTPEGKPMSRLFKEDSLHMNASGYAIWKEAIEPHLKK